MVTDAFRIGIAIAGLPRPLQKVDQFLDQGILGDEYRTYIGIFHRGRLGSGYIPAYPLIFVPEKMGKTACVTKRGGPGTYTIYTIYIYTYVDT